jgi:hypothetical protein
LQIDDRILCWRVKEQSFGFVITRQFLTLKSKNWARDLSHLTLPSNINMEKLSFEFYSSGKAKTLALLMCFTKNTI